MARNNTVEGAAFNSPGVSSAPQSNRASKGVLIFCAASILLHLGAYFFFSNLTWGVNYFYFLPQYVLVLYASLGIAAILFGMQGTADGILKKLLTIWSDKPYLFLTAVVLAFLCFSTLLRVRLPMLGDCFVIVNNYENSIAGIHNLHTFREPLAVYFFYWVIKLFGTIKYPAMLWGFLFGQFFLGIIYVLAVYGIAKLVVTESKHQLMMFFFLLTLPSLQLFLGYAEIYAAVVVATALVVFAVINYLQKSALFFLIYPAYLLLICTHYLSIILFPAFIYVTVIEYRSHGLKNLLAGMGIIAAMGGVLAILFWGDFARLIPLDQHAPYLTLFSPGDNYQTYPLFSVFHFTEMLNLFLLVCPSGLFILAVSLGRIRRISAYSPVDIFLAMCSGIFLVFLLIVKFDLGMAKDWDVTASFFFIFNLTLGVFYLRHPDGTREKNFVLLILSGLIGVLPWFYLNATGKPSMQRTISFLDDRIISREGYYQTSFHLSMAGLAQGDTATLVALWEQYTSKYPHDGKGYEKLTRSYQTANVKDEKVLRAYDAWLSIEPENRWARTQYAQYCSDLGVFYVQCRDENGAKRMFLKSISIDSGYAPAYNYLGYFYDQHGSRDTAEALYYVAIKLNPQYKLPYNNLGNIYRDAGHYDDAIRLYQKAIELDPKYVIAYENLSQAYFALKDRVNTIATLQKAARLGSNAAQRILRQDGESW
jgi:tetratricopeptide (TPR) repeat protein